MENWFYQTHLKSAVAIEWWQQYIPSACSARVCFPRVGKLVLPQLTEPPRKQRVSRVYFRNQCDRPHAFPSETVETACLTMGICLPGGATSLPLQRCNERLKSLFKKQERGRLMLRAFPNNAWVYSWFTTHLTWGCVGTSLSSLDTSGTQQYGIQWNAISHLLAKCHLLPRSRERRALPSCSAAS